MSLEKGKIYLFDPSISSFKHFLKFMKLQDKGSKSLKFSHVSEEGTFVPNLSLKENIFLDSVPHTLTTSKEFQFEKYIRENQNEHILGLLEKVDSLEKLPSAVSREGRKICALFKAFLQEHDFLFLESPLLFLTPENQQLVLMVLKSELKLKERTVLLTTTAPHLWQEHIDYIVTHSLESQRYEINPKTNPTESWKDRISDAA